MRLVVDYQPTLKAVQSAGKQLPFAISKTLNALATTFQLNERGVVERTFLLRRAVFILNTVKIPREGFATKKKLYVDVGIDPTRDFLAKFELGGTKQSLRGGTLSVPLEARPSPSAIVPSRLRGKNLDLLPMRTKAGKVQFKGKLRTFEIERNNFESFVFQRVGRGAGSRLKLLYVRTRAVPIPPELRFFATAAATAQRFKGQDAFDREFAAAMRTAR